MANVVPTSVTGDVALLVQLLLRDEADPASLASQLQPTSPESTIPLRGTVKDGVPATEIDLQISSPRVQFDITTEVEENGIKRTYLAEAFVSRPPRPKNWDWVAESFHYDESTGAYTMGTYDRDTVEALCAGQEFDCNLTVRCNETFRQILEIWAASTATATLATRPATDPILSTFGVKASKSKKHKGERIAFVQTEHSLSGIRGVHVETPKFQWMVIHGSTVPVVLLRIGITGVSAASKRVLMSAVWSSISDFPHTAPLSSRLAIAAASRVFSMAWFLCYRLDPSIGQAIENQIVSTSGAAASPADLCTIVRNELDGFLIAANHWADARESKTKEKFQFRMSNLFGTLLAEHTFASPVALLRVIWARTGPSLKISNRFRNWATYAIGAGHCAEHANLAFDVVRNHVTNGHTHVQSAIRSSNVNIDHAFVLVNYTPQVIYKVIVHNRSSNMRLGAQLAVIDLLADNKVNDNAKAPVIDAYLDPSRGAKTAKALLSSIHRNSRGTKRSHFVELHIAVPAINTPALGIVVVDATSEKFQGI